ncbi:TetR/AcrR family transcriptional regulator [Tabrizicola piscis]|nr:TetR/AcrR family transcriptional regulator [Tabrizicola piscis]
MSRQAERSVATIGSIISAARSLFERQGFDAVSIDDIAVEAGVAKGGIYHHFKSKQDIFESVLNDVQSKLADMIMKKIANNTGKRTPITISQNILAYLEMTTQSSLRNLVLVDGPTVLGWQRWREIDDRHFMAFIQSGILAIVPEEMPQDYVNSATQLIAGAVMEAALSCGVSNDPIATARMHSKVIEQMLIGISIRPPIEDARESAH